MSKHKRDDFVSREHVLDTLSDEEISAVSRAEAHPNLVVGEEFLDLGHLGLGVRVAQEGDTALTNVVPRRAVAPETWQKLVKPLHKPKHAKV